MLYPGGSQTSTGGFPYQSGQKLPDWMLLNMLGANAPQQGIQIDPRDIPYWAPGQPPPQATIPNGRLPIDVGGFPGGGSQLGNKIDIPSRRNAFDRGGYQGSANAMEERMRRGGDQVDQASAEDPNADLLAQLTALAMQSGSGLDVDAMIADATGGINKTYGAQIGAIRHQMQGARKDTRKGKKEILKMYRALGRSEERLGRTEKRQGMTTSRQLEQLGTNAANAAQENANELLNQNAATAGALGSPDLLAQLNTPVNEQTTGIAGRATNEAARNAQQALQTSANFQKYFNESSGSARLEGTGRAADLIGQLQDYLQGSRDKIGEVAGEKAQALAAAKNQILAQASENQTDVQQQNFENMMKIAGLQSDLQNTAADNQLQRDQLMAQLQKAAGGGAGGTDFSDFFSSGYGKNLGLAAEMDPATLKAYNQFRGNPDIASKGYFESGKNNIPLNNENGIFQYVTQNFPNLSGPQRDALVGAIINMGIKPQMPQF